MAKVRGLRGATTVTDDTGEQVIEATSELIREMMSRNDIEKDDLITIIFTATPDITSEFPAAAARKMGISDIPLLCASELGVKGALPRVIRILMHLYTEREYDDLRHVYLRDAKPLRADLAE